MQAPEAANALPVYRVILKGTKYWMCWSRVGTFQMDLRITGCDLGPAFQWYPLLKWRLNIHHIMEATQKDSNRYTSTESNFSLARVWKNTISRGDFILYFVFFGFEKTGFLKNHHWKIELRDRLKGGPQVWWILLLLSLTTSAWLCLQHSRNLGNTF